MVKLTIELECQACGEEIAKLSLHGGSSIETMNLRCGNCYSLTEFTYEALAKMLGKESATKSTNKPEASSQPYSQQTASLYGRPTTKPQKVDRIVKILSDMAGENMDDVSDSLIITEAVRTGQFNDEKDARNHFIRANREGRIFERRPGYWAKA